MKFTLIVWYYFLFFVIEEKDFRYSERVKTTVKKDR